MPGKQIPGVHNLKAHHSHLAALLTLFLGTTAAAQTTVNPTFPEREQGISSYRSGNLKEAIKSLRDATKKNKNDELAFYYLGLALSDTQDMKEARKAFEQAIRLKPDFGVAHTGLAYTLLFTSRARDAESQARYALSLDAKDLQANYILGILLQKRSQCREAVARAEAVLNLDPNYAPAYLLKSQALLCYNNPQQQQAGSISPRTSEAIKSLEKYLELKPNVSDAAVWQEQLQGLRYYAEAVSKPESERTIFTTGTVTTRAHIISKPEPGYTENARRANVVGTVVLRAVLAADGTVQHIYVLSALPFGLTERSVAAAKKIKFEPAIKDGKSVSTFVQLEYNFNLY